MKNSAEKLNIKLSDDNYSVEELDKNKKTAKRKRKENISVSPTLGFVISTYYKGTGMEIVLKALESYIDDENNNVNEINSI